MSNTLRAPEQYMHETIKTVNSPIVDMTYIKEYLPASSI